MFEAIFSLAVAMGDVMSHTCRIRADRTVSLEIQLVMTGTNWINKSI